MLFWLRAFWLLLSLQVTVQPQWIPVKSNYKTATMLVVREFLQEFVKKSALMTITSAKAHNIVSCGAMH